MPRNPAEIERHAAAVLDANNFDRKTVASLIGIKPDTLSRWRGEPEYQALVSRFAETRNDLLSQDLERLAVNIVASASKAIDSLRESLGAEDMDGNPLWSVRHKAAEQLLSALSRVTDEPAAASAGSSASAVVVVRDERPAAGFIEGSAEET